MGAVATCVRGGDASLRFGAAIESTIRYNRIMLFNFHWHCDCERSLWDAGNTGVNIPPVAQDQVVKSLEDNIVEFNVKGVDSRGGILLYTIVVKPTNGIARLIGSNIVYSPNSNVFGIDSLKFKVNNGFLESDAATVTLMIDSVNDAPTAQSQSVSVRNGIASEIKLVGNDVEGSPLTYTEQVQFGPTHQTQQHLELICFRFMSAMEH